MCHLVLHKIAGGYELFATVRAEVRFLSSIGYMMVIKIDFVNNLSQSE